MINKPLYQSQFLLLMLLFLFLIHNNWFLTPPMYILGIAAISKFSNKTLYE